MWSSKRLEHWELWIGERNIGLRTKEFLLWSKLPVFRKTGAWLLCHLFKRIKETTTYSPFFQLPGTIIIWAFGQLTGSKEVKRHSGVFDPERSHGSPSKMSLCILLTFMCNSQKQMVTNQESYPEGTRRSLTLFTKFKVCIVNPSLMFFLGDRMF